MNRSSPTTGSRARLEASRARSARVEAERVASTKSPATSNSRAETARETAKLYDAACVARCSGVMDDVLFRFCTTFEPPERAVHTPEAPAEDYVHRYTTWLACRGTVMCTRLVQAQRQPLTLHAAIATLRRLMRDFYAASRDDVLADLDRLQGFCSLALRYPVLPEVMLDESVCPECVYDAEVTRDTWAEVSGDIACHHMTLRHDLYTTAVAAEANGRNIGDDTEAPSLRVGMARAGPTESMFEDDDNGDDGTRDTSRRRLGFMEQLERLKRQAVVMASRAEIKELHRRLGKLRYSLVELASPRYLSEYPLECLCRMYGSLNRSTARASAMRAPYVHDRADAHTAALMVSSLPSLLSTSASTLHSDALVRLVSTAVIGPVRRHNARYDVVAHRIVLFKHLLSIGFGVETANALVSCVSGCDARRLIGVSLEEGVERQLGSTRNPTSYNLAMARAIWVFAYLSAYCSVRGMPLDHVRMGDDPRELLEDGIYVFDGSCEVGFALNANGGDRSVPVGGTLVLAANELVRLLATRDAMHKRLGER